MTLQDYLDLVTSEHADKAKFVALLTAVLEPLAETRALLESIPGLFDLDVAVGDQLDKTGQWVGVSRQLTTPLTGIYFSLDTPGLGFDQGTWKGPFDPTTGLFSLPDDSYRLLLKAKIAANQWDGTIPGAYDAYNALFNPVGATVLIQDYDDMSMAVALLGGTLNAVTVAMLKNGLLDLRPAGVGVLGYFTGTAPLFGFDVDTNFWPNPANGLTWATANCTVAAAGQINGAPAFSFTINTSGLNGNFFGPLNQAAKAGDSYRYTISLLAGSVSTMFLGIFGALDAWGADDLSTGAIVSGPGTISQADGGLWGVAGLSPTIPTVVTVTRTAAIDDVFRWYAYVENYTTPHAGSSVIVASPFAVNLADPPANISGFDAGSWAIAL